MPATVLELRFRNKQHKKEGNQLYFINQLNSYQDLQVGRRILDPYKFVPVRNKKYSKQNMLIR